VHVVTLALFVLVVATFARVVESEEWEG
jgi:hypothetical protein